MKKKSICLAILIGIFYTIFFSMNVYAADGAKIMEKWIFTQFYYCVQNNYINTPLAQKDSGYVKDDIFQKKGDIALPSYNFQNSANNGSINCKDLFLGNSKISSGVLGYSKIGGSDIEWSHRQKSQDFLEKLGYKLSASSTSQDFTINANKDGVSQSAIITAEKGADGHVSYKRSGVDNFFASIKVQIDNKKNQLRVYVDSINPQCSPMYENQNVTFDLVDDTQTLFKNIENTLNNRTWGLKCYISYIANYDSYGNPIYGYQNTEDTYTFSTTFGPIVESGDKGNFVYADGSSKYDTVTTAIKNLSGMGILDLQLTNNELYELYYYYLEQSIPTGVTNRITCNPTNTDNLTAVKLKDNDGTFKTCYVNFNGIDPNGIKVNTQRRSAYGYRQPYVFIDSITMSDVISWFNSVDESTLDDVTAINNSNQPDDPPDANCGNSGGAGSLGWIICPVISGIADASEIIYKDFVKPNLEIQPKLFSRDPTDGTRQAWGTFQTIANICFTILILVVIFSQLTGVGIDNYGIKKILPKLIIVAILVNLSYFICLICVDLSNILGNGLQAMFNGLSATPAEIVIEGEKPSGVGATVLTSIGIFTAVFGLGAAVWSNPAIVLSMLVSALGIIISILFLFILLSAREAAVVVLTVISPVAFVCYALPNTKKLFDKWIKIWQGLLLVYPIAGLLVGGGDYVSRLLLSTGFATQGFLPAFTAMLVGVIPIFFIPTVLKGSFAALGNIGSKISGFGDRMRSGATNKIRSSEGYKSTQKRGLERKARVKAGLNADGTPTKRGALKARIANSKPGKLFGYQSLQASRIAAANKTREEGIQATSELGKVLTDYEAKGSTDSTEKILEKKLEMARDNGDANEIFAIIEQAKKSNIQASHLADMTRKVLGNGIGKSPSINRGFLEEFGRRYGGDFLKKDFEQADWARKGGIAAGGGLAGLAGWAGSNIAIDDLKDEDVAALSSARLHDLINAGKISRPQAQRVWASNGNMDDTNRLMLGAYGNNSDILTKEDAQEALKGTYAGTAAGYSKDKVDALTRRAAEATIIEDVKIRNVNDGGSTQSDTLKVDHGPAP